MTPLEHKVNFESDADNGRNSSSQLIPLPDQDSMTSQKDTDLENIVYDDEQKEKAAVIQELYRKKMK